MVTLCLAGSAAEKQFCGSIDDGGDRADYDMARAYLARQSVASRGRPSALPRRRATLGAEHVGTGTYSVARRRFTALWHAEW
jgi:hypothetical protein